MPNALPSTAAASPNVATPGNCTNNSTCSIQLYNHVLTPLGSDYCRLFRHGPRQEACRADLAAKLARPLIGPGFKLRIYLHYPLGGTMPGIGLDAGSPSVSCPLSTKKSISLFGLNGWPAFRGLALTPVTELPRTPTVASSSACAALAWFARYV